MAQSDRVNLGTYLKTQTGIPNTYFNPPESKKLSYPCIVYERDDIDPLYADNIPYGLFFRYQLTLIDTDPDSEYVEKIAKLPQCRYSRHFNSDNLSHDVFTIYYK